MHLSIVIPSNRDSLAAYGRILQACALASDEIEVVVRDNSGSARKAEFLGRIDQPNCRVIVAEPCDVYTNFEQALRASRGDFVLCLGDDDIGLPRGLGAFAATAGLCAGDASVAALTGSYVLEQSGQSQIVRYPQIDSIAVTERLGGYLGYQGPNLIFYSAIRRAPMLETWDFILGHPFRFSFHDQFYSLIYLLGGRFVDVGRLTIVIDNGQWEAIDAAARSDMKFYAADGLDPAMRKLHWMLCGFEGAYIILQSRFGRRYPLAERQAMANQWFEIMVRRFVGDADARFDSPLAAEAERLYEAWRGAVPNFTLESLLVDICGFIRLFSPQKARAYEDFWTAVAAGGPAAP